MIDRLSDMLKEGGEWSFTRWLSFIGFLAFLVASGYLMYSGKNWAGYDTFASLTGGGGCVSQLVNKFINGKYNTPMGEAGKPLSRKEAV